MKRHLLVAACCGLPLLAPPRAFCQAIDTPPPGAEQAYAAPALHGSISLRDAIAAALLGSPDLAAFAAEIQASDARAVQAAAWPNPELAVEIENVGGDDERAGFEQSETTVWLAQLVELGGKRAGRRDAAARAGELAHWDYEAARLSVSRATTRAFIVALGGQQRHALAERRVTLTRRSVAAAKKRVEAGAAPAVDVTRAELELVTARLALRRSAADRDAAYATLATTWGASAPTFSTLRGDLSAELQPPAAAALLEEALVENPAVARWRSEIAARQVALSLARAQRVPDATLSLGARYFADTGDAALVLAFAVPLPVFDRKRGEILAAGHDLSKVRALENAARLALRAELVQRRAELAAAYDAVVTLRQHGLPAAERAFAATRAGYEQGRFSSLDVLDAQHTLFDMRRAELDALIDYQLARAELDALTGGGAGATTGAGEVPR